MSTRCQVRVEGDVRVLGAENTVRDRLTLYHHSDGYPSYMVRTFVTAFDKYGRGWEGNRVGKVASFLCAVDPGSYEPEDGHQLHGDIEFFYEVHLGSDMTVGARGTWTIKVFEVGGGWGDDQELKLIDEIHLNTNTFEVIAAQYPSLEATHGFQTHSGGI